MSYSPAFTRLIHDTQRPQNRLRQLNVVGPTQLAVTWEVRHDQFPPCQRWSGPSADAERYAPPRSIVEGRPSPMEWIRSRRVERESRRAEQAHQRAAQRLGALGKDWRVLDLQATAGSDR